MAAFTTALLAVSGIIGNVAAEQPGTVAMKFARSQPRRHIVNKRDPTSVNIGNAENVGLYYVNASVGTPAQEIQLQIDTGSSDVWMFNRAACYEADCLGGYYEARNSSTYKLLNPQAFSIQYVTPGSGVQGDYISDVFALGSLKLQNLTMAVGTQAKQVQTGIMGIGFDSDESIVSNGGSVYPSIIDVMYNQSVIKSHSYSLWLDDIYASEGTVLFGGYDSSKYLGPLTVLDIQPDAMSGTISSFTVAWSLLALSDSTGTTVIDAENFPYAAVLDSGTTLMAVPQPVYDALAGYFGVINTEEYGAVFRCSYGKWNGTLDFGFGGANGAIIQVPFSELAVNTTDEEGKPLKFKNGDQACLFGIQPTPQEGTYLLGDTLLRSAYVVYDLDAQQVGIAQTNWNSNSNNNKISAISAGTALQSLIPSATYVSGPTISQSMASASATLIEPGNGITFTGSDVEGSTTATATGTLSHIAGQKTTLPVAALTQTPTANGGSGSGGSASGSSKASGASGAPAATSSGAAVSAVGMPTESRALLFSAATFMIMVVGGAALFAPF